MMALHLYCIVPAGHQPPGGLAGVDDAPVRSADAGPLAAWYTETPFRRQPDTEAIREHHQVVVAALTEAVTPVPIRFGESAADEAALRGRLREREAEYLRLLEHVAGAVEFGLRMVPAGRDAAGEPPAPAPTGPGAGRAYMELLVRRRASREASRELVELVARALREAVPGGIRDERCESPANGGATMSVLHLVERTQSERYRAAVGSARREFADLRFLLTGPWPPYSFVA